MTDFFTRMLRRNRRMVRLVRPLMHSHFAPGMEISPYLEKSVEVEQENNAQIDATYPSEPFSPSPPVKDVAAREHKANEAKDETGGAGTETKVQITNDLTGKPVRRKEAVEDAVKVPPSSTKTVQEKPSPTPLASKGVSTAGEPPHLSRKASKGVSTAGEPPRLSRKASEPFSPSPPVKDVAAREHKANEAKDETGGAGTETEVQITNDLTGKPVRRKEAVEDAPRVPPFSTPGLSVTTDAVSYQTARIPETTFADSRPDVKNTGSPEPAVVGRGGTKHGAIKKSREQKNKTKVSELHKETETDELPPSVPPGNKELAAKLAPPATAKPQKSGVGKNISPPHISEAPVISPSPMVQEESVMSAHSQSASPAGLKPEMTRTNPQKEAKTVLTGPRPIRGKHAIDTLLENGVYQRPASMEHAEASTPGHNLLEAASTDFHRPASKEQSKKIAADIAKIGMEPVSADPLPPIGEKEKPVENIVKPPLFGRVISPKVFPYAKTVKTAQADRHTPANEPFTPSSDIMVNIGSIEMHSVPAPAPLESRATKPRTGPFLTLGEYLKQRNGEGR